MYKKMQKNQEIYGIKLHLNSLSQTEALGMLLADLAHPGDIICLDGELGAGKTTLTQAIARGLSVPESSYVASPSFAILHEHKGRIPLYHMDFYRLGDPAEIEEHGFSEYFYKSGLCVIEWAKVGEGMLPDIRLSLQLSFNDQGVRQVTIRGRLIRDDFKDIFLDTLEKSSLQIA